jgi:hypothetical protein
MGAERRVDDVPGAAVAAGEQVRIGTEGERGVGVAESFADCLDRLAAVEKDAGVVVAQAWQPLSRVAGMPRESKAGFQILALK